MSKSTTTGLLDYLQKHGSVLPEEIVPIKQWGRDVVLRGLSARERDLFEEESLRRASAKASNGARRRGAVEADLSNFRARLVALHIVEDGQRVFANPRGEELLGDQPATVLDRLFSVSQRLSGFSPEDIDNLSGNSSATGADETSSASRPSSDAPSPTSNGGSASAS
jgi:hypothetical protein